MMHSQLKLRLDQEFDLRHPVAKGELRAALIEMKARRTLDSSEVQTLCHLLEDMQTERETLVKRDRIVDAFKKMQAEIQKTLREECCPGEFALLTGRLDMIYDDMLTALASDDTDA